MATKKQIEEWKTKAEKWDALDKVISRYYFKDGQEDVIDDPEQEGDLGDIGELAASAFGYL